MSSAAAGKRPQQCQRIDARPLRDELDIVEARIGGRRHQVEIARSRYAESRLSGLATPSALPLTLSGPHQPYVPSSASTRVPVKKPALRWARDQPAERSPRSCSAEPRSRAWEAISGSWPGALQPGEFSVSPLLMALRRQERGAHDLRQPRLFLPGRCFVGVIPPVCLAYRCPANPFCAIPAVRGSQVSRGGGRRPIRLRWS